MGGRSAWFATLHGFVSLVSRVCGAVVTARLGLIIGVVRRDESVLRVPWNWDGDGHLDGEFEVVLPLGRLPCPVRPDCDACFLCCPLQM